MSAQSMSETQDTGVVPDAPLLEVDDLYVEFHTRDGVAKVLNGVSYHVNAGETLAVLGESGSGKSVTAQAIMGILDIPPAVVTGGEIRYHGENLLAVNEERRNEVRAEGIAMVFQDALSALNPVFTVGFQIEEQLRVRLGMSRREARKRAIGLLDLVRIPNAVRRIRQYPHEFSGGMRQRAMIAMSLALDPEVLIADEPTTALDVTVQAQILDLMKDLQKEFNSAIIIITHDLGVVAEVTDDTLVMYGGRAVEYGKTSEILTHPEMPYTWGLLSSVPDVTGDTTAKLIPIPGNPPSLLNPPSGCHFHPRCTFRDKVAGDLCRTTTPELAPGGRGPNHLKRCHLPDPESIYQTEILPEIAPDLVELLTEEER